MTEVKNFLIGAALRDTWRVSWGENLTLASQGKE